jgi:hypothetical protein
MSALDDLRASEDPGIGTTMRRSKLSPDATFAIPEFWLGVAATRDELRCGDAGVARGIARDLRKGTPLRQIADFLAWERKRR